jgi:signal peptidase I
MKDYWGLVFWKMLGMFVIGFGSCAILAFGFGGDLEFPSSISGFGIRDLGLGGADVVSAPSDHVSEDDIIVLGDRVILRIEGVTLSNYVDSGSMVPVLDKGANGIRVVPSNESDVEVGDIVSFRSSGILIVHRVAQKGVDNEGVWFEVKGDANLVGDGKIRFEDIEYVTVGILY